MNVSLSPALLFQVFRGEGAGRLCINQCLAKKLQSKEAIPMDNVQNFSFGMQAEEGFNHNLLDISVRLRGAKGPRSLQGIADSKGAICPIKVCSTFIQKLQSQGTEAAVDPIAIIKAVAARISDRESNILFSLPFHIYENFH